MNQIGQYLIQLLSIFAGRLALYTETLFSATWFY